MAGVAADDHSIGDRQSGRLSVLLSDTLSISWCKYYLLASRFPHTCLENGLVLPVALRVLLTG